MLADLKLGDLMLVDLKLGEARLEVIS